MFIPETSIAMADGTCKSIVDVCPGDLILSSEGHLSRVENVEQFPFNDYIIQVDYQDKGVVFAHEDQLFLTDHDMVFAWALVPGERLRTPAYDAEGRFVYWDVESTRHVPFTGQIYSIATSDDAGYVAGGVAVAERLK